MDVVTLAAAKVAARKSTTNRRLFGTLPAPICAGRPVKPGALSALTGVTFQRVYTLYATVPQIRLVFSNVALPGSADATPESSAGAYTLKVGLIWGYLGASPVNIPVTFNNARTITVDTYQTWVSDPIDVPSTQGVGTSFVVRSYVTQAGTFLPMTNAPWGGNPAGWNESYFAADRTDLTGNNYADGTNDGQSQFGPIVVGWSADGANRQTLISGDSIAAGTGYQSYSGGFGFIGYALDQAKIGALNLAHSGEKLHTVLASYANQRMRLTMAYGCANVITQYGANDLYGASPSTAAQLKADYLAWWAMLRAKGCAVWQTTILPSSNSTDGWQTVTGQSSRNATADAARAVINQWLRAPASAGAGNSAMFDAGGNLAGVFDTALPVEVNANGTPITINPATGAISNGAGGLFYTESTTYATGTTTTTAANRLTDTSKTWTANQWVDYAMVITADATTPASVGQVRIIAANAATTLTTDTNFTVTPSVGATYKLVKTFNFDGVHPTTFGHRRAAAGIDTSRLVTV